MSDLYRRCVGSKYAVEQALRFTKVAASVNFRNVNPRIETLNSVMTSDRYFIMCQQELKKRQSIHRVNLKALRDAGADPGLIKALTPGVETAYNETVTFKKVVER